MVDCVAVLAVPANQVTEEVVEDEIQPPPTRKRRLESSSNHTDSGDTVSHETDRR